MQRDNFFEPDDERPIYELLGAWDLVGRRRAPKNLSSKVEHFHA